MPRPTLLFLDRLMYSFFEIPFFRAKILASGFRLTKNPRKADVILSSYMHVIKRYLPYRKKYLIWTHEPYHDLSTKSIVKVGTQKIHIMNVYTGDVFLNNHRYFYFKEELPLLTPENFPNFKDPKKTIIAFSTNYRPSHYSGIRTSLLPQRYEVINYGYKTGKLKVWGKGWGNKSSGNSRTSQNREEEKAKILETYDFNLAIESMSAKYYVSEKLWESIASLCLPIYYSNSSIYEDFPKQSFIDYKDFSGRPEKLFQYIENMTVEEYRERMNSCIKVFNKIVKSNQNQLQKCSNPDLEKVDYAQSYPYFLKKLKQIIRNT